ncbi:MAG: ABC transporter ATP-binding protein [Acidobacteria bacterium]|nr:ABC transporter ATP-binding protein [Acidobacteriota bacterium]
MSDGAPPIVQTVGVSRTYDGGRIRAVSDVTVAIAAGESVAIAGPSGSGKSTLLHLLCGLERPTGGAVLVDGIEPRSASQWAAIRARRIALVFQNFNLLPMLTARENVEVPMFGVVAGAARRRQRALTLLEEFGLAGRVNQRPHELSGGERQRVAIARSLANDPDLLLADEPTGSLDSATATVTLRLLVDLRVRRRLALVIVTHDPVVAATAGRRLSMIDGRLTKG